MYSFPLGWKFLRHKIDLGQELVTPLLDHVNSWYLHKMHRPCSDSERFGGNHLSQFQFFGGACSPPDASKRAPFKAEEWAWWIFSLCLVSELESPSETLYLLQLYPNIFTSLSNTRKSEVIKTRAINQKINVRTFRSLKFFLVNKTGDRERQAGKIKNGNETENCEWSYC